MNALVIASAGLFVLAAREYGSKAFSGPSSGVTAALNDAVSNGYQFRDVTYTSVIDIAHPDVKNNLFAVSGSLARDLGTNGIKRAYVQLYNGSSEITQISRAENLFL